VHACRYVGLLDASVAAYHRATRLDPGIATTAAHTFLMLGQYQRAIDIDADHVPYISMVAHLSLGQPDQTGALVERSRAAAGNSPALTLMLDMFVAALSGRPAEGRQAIDRLMAFPAFSDPEGWYYWSLASAQMREHDFSFELLERAVSSGFHCPRALETSPLLDDLRGSARFARLLGIAREGHDAAAIAFTKADGHRLLGLPRP
jgi:hypothetical protein